MADNIANGKDEKIILLVALYEIPPQIMQASPKDNVIIVNEKKLYGIRTKPNIYSTTNITQNKRKRRIKRK